ncbi:MAG: hypothetical protein ACRDO4_13130 [Nocardioides sp.]
MTAARWVALGVAVPLALVASACSGPERELNDAASCPGDTCTDDTRARVDAIGALDGVTEVVEVTREYGFDRGSHRTAEVRTDASNAREMRDVALAVMRALEDWPDHADGGATVVVESPVEPPATFLLDGDWVCEQPSGMRVACTTDNSWTLEGEPASS